MKLFNLLLLALLISSCEKSANSDYEDYRNQILGTWQLNASTETSKDGLLINFTTVTETVSFTSDGKGERLNSFFGVQDIEWIYQLSPEKISIANKSTDANSGFLWLGETHHFDVIENSESFQEWISTDNTFAYIDSTTQIVDRVIKWQMTKQ